MNEIISHEIFKSNNYNLTITEETKTLYYVYGCSFDSFKEALFYAKNTEQKQIIASFFDEKINQLPRSILNASYPSEDLTTILLLFNDFLSKQQDFEKMAFLFNTQKAP
jgi:hypothetical protein